MRNKLRFFRCCRSAPTWGGPSSLHTALPLLHVRSCSSPWYVIKTKASWNQSPPELERVFSFNPPSQRPTRTLGADLASRAQWPWRPQRPLESIPERVSPPIPSHQHRAHLPPTYSPSLPTPLQVVDLRDARGPKIVSQSVIVQSNGVFPMTVVREAEFAPVFDDHLCGRD